MPRLFLGNLPSDVDVRDIEKHFENCGEIVDLVLKPNFGFIEFGSEADAEKAIQRSGDFRGKRLVIEEARKRVDGRNPGGDRGPGPSRGDYRIRVENVSASIRWQELKNFGAEAGDTTFADCHKIREGLGILEYRTDSDMRNALRKLDGQKLGELRVRLSEEGSSRGFGRRSSRSRSPSYRDRYGGGYRRRYPSRSRSRSPIRRERSPIRRHRSPPRRRYSPSRRERSPFRRSNRSPPPRNNRYSPPRERSYSRGNGGSYDRGGKYDRSSRSPPPLQSEARSPPAQPVDEDVFNGDVGGSPKHVSTDGWD